MLPRWKIIGTKISDRIKKTRKNEKISINWNEKEWDREREWECVYKKRQINL